MGKEQDLFGINEQTFPLFDFVIKKHIYAQWYEILDLYTAYTQRKLRNVTNDKVKLISAFKTFYFIVNPLVFKVYGHDRAMAFRNIFINIQKNNDVADNEIDGFMNITGNFILDSGISDITKSMPNWEKEFNETSFSG